MNRDMAQNPITNLTARIKGAIRRDDTMLRLLTWMCGHNTTWAMDDRQFVSVSDGINMSNPPTEAFHARVYALRGDPPNPVFEELSGYPHMPMRVEESEYASFWGGSCLAVDTRIYQTLMTTNHPYIRPDGTFWPGFRPIGTKLIYSDDNGVSWRNQDGSRPVKWENWNQRSRDNMLFYDEEGGVDSFLQMGRGYSENLDGYVYIYGTCRGENLILARVAKDRVLNRECYEYFAGVSESGKAAWSSDVRKMQYLHTFPKGWVSTKDDDGVFPAGWAINAVYNQGLGAYLLVGQGTGVGADGGWFGKPSYLGLWVASNPWGPFRQIHEEKEWTPGGNAGARAYAPQIPPKWISPNGRSFWLVWSDYQHKDAAGGINNPDADILEFLKKASDDREYARMFLDWTRRNMPGMGFNLQRVDLQVEG